ncbi:MAG TPA: exodeoxyribonuclease III [Burkholderiales bacterium]|jgi:exodeoxyribonuclease III|nr:exodeoxyribonuclease III [Burkholderiales bacterium]
MKFASWNVNSLKVRLPHLLEWLARQAPQVVCLQETKLEDAKFPVGEIEAAGYHCVWSGQKTYNGIAILSRPPLADVAAGMPAFADEQKRVIAATVGQGADAIRVVCAYVPNGQAVDSGKYQYKLNWLAAFRLWLEEEQKKNPRLAVLGDYNIAPADEDVHDPKAWEGQILCSPKEREAFRNLLALGLKDSFRMFAQPAKSFTWWDYRMNGFKRNLGLRIDHILLSSELASRCRTCSIDLEPRRLQRPSDHAPVMAELEL